MIDNLAELVRPCGLPGKTAYVDLAEPSARQWSAAGFDGAIDSIATGLAALDLPPASRIGLLGGNGAGTLQTYFAIMRAGHVVVPLNYRLPAATIDFIAKDADLALIFADEERHPLVPASIVGRMIVPGAEEGVFDSAAPAPGQPAKIIYTSGSTGRPKGVVLSHAGQVWAIRHGLSPAAADDCMIVAAPLYHKNGLYNSTMALAQGVRMVSLPRFEARAYLQAIAAWRATTLTGVPTMFALMERESDLLATLDLTSVRRVSIGSAPLSDLLARRITAMFPQAELSNGYGTTEAGPIVFGPHPQGLSRPLTSLGVPATGVEWRIAGGDMEGVLKLRTPAVMSEYLNQPALTADKLNDDWYDTGDIVRRDADGFFHFVGRADDMFVCGGENVFPAEVETLLESHPDVAQAAVVPAPDFIKGQIPVAFVVPRAGTHPDGATLKRFALENGPAYSHPRAFVLRDALPLASTHKIDRQMLMAEAVVVAAALDRD
ncbi:MAG: hypothetical protein B7Y43_07165 [Sphingomonas sp. 28-62-20]|uniref:class I adenylate-forming enzyme family protein n=1 Tax=Sphingomonas sp. 28-62-20 TaxID=1970433 RepID=UPI000BD9FAE4|nr:MAG: hypothetical protein B7Y43_07165 [Sphingomonas sp. 28-62-20]